MDGRGQQKGRHPERAAVRPFGALCRPYSDNDARAHAVTGSPQELATSRVFSSGWAWPSFAVEG